MVSPVVSRKDGRQRRKPYLGGKNSTDMHLCVDAMEILITRPNIDVFAVVSSDSDFNPLIQRLREHGKVVLRFGSVQTSFMARQSGDVFVELQQLGSKRKREREVEERVFAKPGRKESSDTSKKEVVLGEATREAEARAAGEAPEAKGVKKNEVDAESALLLKGMRALVRKTLFDLERQGVLQSRTFEVGSDQGSDEAAGASDGWMLSDHLAITMKRLQRDWLGRLREIRVSWVQFLRDCKKLEVQQEVLATHAKHVNSRWWVRLAMSALEAYEAKAESGQLKLVEMPPLCGDEADERGKPQTSGSKSPPRRCGTVRSKKRRLRPKKKMKSWRSDCKHGGQYHLRSAASRRPAEATALAAVPNEANSSGERQSSGAATHGTSPGETPKVVSDVHLC